MDVQEVARNVTTMDKLCLSTHDELHVLLLNHVLYIKADDHYCQVMYQNGTSIMLPYGLGYVEEQIKQREPHATLKRLGRTYIVNIARIIHIHTPRKQLVLIDSTGKRHTLQFTKELLREVMQLIAHENK